MPNPYFEPDSFNYNDYGLTVFQPDMVLTHKQLNTIFGFLLGQEQRTRTRMIGVGVICGLEVSRGNGATVKITRGCGVSSEGDLLCLENDLLCSTYLPYILADHAPYAPFSAINGLELWEIFPAEYVPTDTPQQLTSAILSDDKVVMLYLESQVKDADECTGVACDNKGDLFLNRLHVLLVRKADASQLIRLAHRQAAAACSRLPRAVMRRVRLDDRPYDMSLRDFQTFIKNAVNNFSSQLFQSFTLVNHALYPALADNALVPSPVPDWINTMQAKMQQYSKGPYIQYLYAWLKDLNDAYEEFREAACHWLVDCMPAEDLFPKHLLLGELTLDTGFCRPQYRHYFRKSPAVAPDPYARERIGWLYERIGKLIQNFEVPAPRIQDTREIGVKITPDHYRIATVPLSRRSMPFYYLPDTRQYWNFDLWKCCQTGHILSYHLPAAPLPYVEQPFSYGIETYAFYRIEGFIGSSIYLALSNILALRQQHNLAFEVVALRADANQILITTGQAFEFEDLMSDFDNIMQQIRCETETLKLPISPNLTLQMPVAVFTTNLNTYIRNERIRREAKCILEKLPLLQRLNAEYNRRKSAYEASLTFGGFLLEHPGMEHGGGVPRGGTFVVVYKNLVGAGKNPLPVAIADFYLPYCCCSKGNSIKFVLPEPPPSISLPKVRFCVGEPTARLTLSPSGGSFPARTPNITKKAEAYFFTPRVVGQQTLVYTAPDGRTASLEVEVFALPTAAFVADPANDTVVLVNQSTGATSVVWDFGDGSPTETITLGANVNGNTRHQYQVPADGSPVTFEVRLTALNAALCTHVVAHAVVVKARINVVLTASDLYCFSTEQTAQVQAQPGGGIFSSARLTFNENGAFLPNVIGKHTILYELSGQGAASANIFILPGQFQATNTANPPGRGGFFEVLVSTPPTGLKYLWTIDDQPIEASRSATEPGRRGYTRYFFTMAGLTQSRDVKLGLEFIRDNGQRVCERITQPFNIIAQRPENPIA